MPIFTWKGMISSSMHFTHCSCCPGRMWYCRSSKNIAISSVRVHCPSAAPPPRSGVQPSTGCEARSAAGRPGPDCTRIPDGMPQLVCGCCLGSVRAPAAWAAAGGARRPAGSSHARPAPPGPAAGRSSANPGVQGYSPPPPPVSPIKGLIDFHTHAAPDIFGRSLDDDELATLAATRQMEAVVFKNHVTHTADRAFLVRKHVPGIRVFGGITLNHAVGGLNPQAVEWMWRMQGGYGRVVWFPTFDADNHVRRAGTAPGGIRVVDDRGEVLPAAREVLKVCARQKLVVQTGHASPDEALALIAAAREEGCDRLVVTHAQFDVVGMSVEHMKQAAKLGAKLELCALLMLAGPTSPLAFMHHTARVEIADTAARVKAVGAQHFVLGTDLGQAGNPTPADGLQMLVAGLLEEGITRDQIQTMGREIPGALLMG